MHSVLNNKTKLFHHTSALYYLLTPHRFGTWQDSSREVVCFTCTRDTAKFGLHRPMNCLTLFFAGLGSLVRTETNGSEPRTVLMILHFVCRTVNPRDKDCKYLFSCPVLLFSNNFKEIYLFAHSIDYIVRLMYVQFNLIFQNTSFLIFDIW